MLRRNRMKENNEKKKRINNSYMKENLLTDTGEPVWVNNLEEHNEEEYKVETMQIEEKNVEKDTEEVKEIEVIETKKPENKGKKK